LPTADAKGQFSLLGLGDIVIPGIFIALLMRYDAVRAVVNPVNAENKAFPKPYFMANIIAYALGLLLTVMVMFFFEAAQVIIAEKE
jgi:minor histocompatibility antigen H13